MRTVVPELSDRSRRPIHCVALSNSFEFPATTITAYHPRHRLKLDYSVPPSVFVGLKNALKFVYHGFRRRRFKRINPDENLIA